jgi:hypothetical protein
MAASNKITAYTNKDRLQVTVTEANGVLTIKDADTDKNFSDPKDVAGPFDATGTHAELQLSERYYFPETSYPKEGVAPLNNTYVTPNRLTYSENRLVLQSMTIPLKIRPAIGSAKYKDSLPSQVETGFNAGFALGVKRTWSIFKPELNALGSNTTKLSLTPGVFVNLGAADVKKLTTNYTITVERKEPVLSYGLFFMIGFNNINIGYSIGGDHLLSENKKTWVYQGKYWHGITVALDIIK